MIIELTDKEEEMIDNLKIGESLFLSEARGALIKVNDDELLWI